MNDPSTEPLHGPEHRPPLQFRLRAILGTMVAVSLIFGLLRWLEVPPTVSYLIMGILVVAALAAVGLVVVIASSMGGEDRKPPV